ARGYVNAVLRAVAGVGPNWPWPGGESVAALAVRLSYPDWIVEVLVAQFGLADARASLEVANEPPPVALRVNPERASVQAAADELRAAGVEVTPGTLAAGSSPATSIRGASVSSHRRETGSGSIGSSRWSPTAGRSRSGRRAPTGPSSTRRAAAWASSAAVPSCGGASGPETSPGSWRS